MARTKQVRRCYDCGTLFTWEKGANDANGNFVKDTEGSVRQLEVATGKIHYCAKKTQRDNISGETTETVNTETVHTGETIENVKPKTDTVTETIYREVTEKVDASEVLTDAGKAIYKLIEDAIEKRLESFTPKTAETIHTYRIEIDNRATDTVLIIDGAHHLTARLLRYLKLRKNVLLVGPAGSGKTHSANVARKALGLNFYPQSVGPQTSKSDLIGYIDAMGKLVRTPGREAYEHGGVWLIDEIDAANAAVLTIINMMLDSEQASFPDGTVTRHPDFRVIASANTYGNGANRQYVGRNQLDAATLNRFVGIDWDYDTALEAQLCPNREWLDYIYKLRAVQERLKIRVVISLRNIINGADMLADGIERDEVENSSLWFGVSADDKAKLLAGIRSAI